MSALPLTTHEAAERLRGVIEGMEARRLADLAAKDEAIGELLGYLDYEHPAETASLAVRLGFDARAAGEDLLDDVSDLGWA